jgi:hypothetical protein
MTVNTILDDLDLCSSAGIPWSIMVGIVSSMGTVMGNIKEPSTTPAGGAATRVAKGTCDPHGFLTSSRKRDLRDPSIPLS